MALFERLFDGLGNVGHVFLFFGVGYHGLDVLIASEASLGRRHRHQHLIAPVLAKGLAILHEADDRKALAVELELAAQEGGQAKQLLAHLLPNHADPAQLVQVGVEQEAPLGDLPVVHLGRTRAKYRPH